MNSVSLYRTEMFMNFDLEIVILAENVSFMNDLIVYRRIMIMNFKSDVKRLRALICPWLRSRWQCLPTGMTRVLE